MCKCWSFPGTVQARWLKQLFQPLTIHIWSSSGSRMHVLTPKYHLYEIPNPVSNHLKKRSCEQCQNITEGRGKAATTF